jgi:hypothetical protein
MRFSTSQTAFLCALCGVFAVGMGSETRAQTTATVTPAPADTSTKGQSSSSANEEPPPGGCMPIGITVSGEVVFPFQCKDFIDRHKAANRNSVVPPDMPDWALGNAVAKPSEAVAATPAAKASEAATATPEIKARDSVAATPEAKAPETVTATPEVKAPESVAATPEVKAPESVAATPEVKAPETVGTTPEVKGPEGVAVTPEVKTPETVVPPTDKPARPFAYKTATSRGAGDPSTLAKRPPGCVHFRTYDPVSHTYTAYGGQRRPCL